MSLTVMVTQSNIDRAEDDYDLGTTSHERCCPIAQALWEDGYEDVTVFGPWVSFLPPAGEKKQPRTYQRYRIDSESDAYRFISAFDYAMTEPDRDYDKWDEIIKPQTFVFTEKVTEGALRQGWS